MSDCLIAEADKESIILFVFLALQPIVVFSQPGSGL
jgi:hypothetical protein